MKTELVYADDDSTDLTRYFLAFWRFRYVFAVTSLVLGLGAFVQAKLSPPVYEAVARLLVVTSRGEGPGVGLATFRALVQNESLGAKLIRELGLNQPPHRIEPGDFSRGLVNVELDHEAHVLVIRVRLTDAKLAARFANRLALAAEELVQEISQRDAISARDIIKAQLGEARVSMDQAAVELKDYRSATQIELLRKDVDALLNQRGELLSLLVGIQSEKARLAQAEAQLAQRQRIDTLLRTVGDGPLVLEAERSRTGAPAVTGLQLKTESVNLVYEDLEKVVTSSRTRLAGLEMQKTQLVDVRKLDADQLAKLTLLYEREAALARLQIEHELASAVYRDVAVRYEQARLRVAGRTSALQVFDSALVPDNPVGPRVVRAAVMGLILGLAVTAIAVILVEALKSVRGASRKAAS